MTIRSTILIFLVGVLFGIFLSSVNIGGQNSIYENTFSINSSLVPDKLDCPTDRIKEDDIRIYDNMIVIRKSNAILARFTDTRSMEPILDKDSNAIEIKPDNIEDIKVGDIISYKSHLAEGIIIHRIVEKGYDEKGIYFRTKGDNLQDIDPEKIRPKQVQRVVIGILY